MCFYPMNRKREGDQNWFLLDFQERERLMGEHGETGMQYAGKVTQLVQSRILKTLDQLIDEARKNQQQQQQQQQSEEQQQAQADPNAKPQPSDAGQSQQNASTPAQKSQVTPGATPPSPSGDIRETAKDWGGISQRDRQAIIESASENIIEKYRTLTEDYYRALSVKAAEKK